MSILRRRNGFSRPLYCVWVSRNPGTVLATRYALLTSVRSLHRAYVLLRRVADMREVLGDDDAASVVNHVRGFAYGELGALGTVQIWSERDYRSQGQTREWGCRRVRLNVWEISLLTAQLRRASQYCKLGDLRIGGIPFVLSFFRAA